MAPSLEVIHTEYKLTLQCESSINNNTKAMGHVKVFRRQTEKQTKDRLDKVICP